VLRNLWSHAADLPNLVRKLLIMTSKLGAYLKTKEATGSTTGHTDLPNPNADLNPNSNLAVNRHET